MQLQMGNKKENDGKGERRSEAERGSEGALEGLSKKRWVGEEKKNSNKKIKRQQVRKGRQERETEV